MALRGDSTVVAWGSRDYGVIDVPAGVNDVIVIAVDNLNSVLGFADGRIITFGTSNFNALVSRTPTNTSNPTLTASETLIPTESLTPSNTRTETPTITLTASKIPTRTR
jgi:hypothetical protein